MPLMPSFSLEAEQDSGNINKTQSKATPNEAGSQETTSGGGPRCQETMGDTIAQTRNYPVSVQNVDEEMFDVNVLDGEECCYNNYCSPLIEIKGTKPKEKEVVIQELCESTTIISSQQSEDKGKGILIEHVKPMKKKIQIRFDEETTLNLQDEFDEEEILAKIDVDHQLAERMQEQEQEEFVWKAKKEKQELIQESTKKQKVEDDKEIEELKQCLEIILDEEEVTIDAIPLAVKSPTGVSTAHELQRKYAKCLLLLVHNCSAEVNAASENMLEVTTASEYQVNAAS
ncbi:hypothetical protein Tco_0770264 [Tanacetum coccineum]|uniref:Uncharacterized protein n=1 Tax=Tanacetum coccineum TaxID=301880 RepID=A0ABQ4ZBP8_9ASTR